MLMQRTNNSLKQNGKNGIIAHPFKFTKNKFNNYCKCELVIFQILSRTVIHCQTSMYQVASCPTSHTDKGVCDWLSSQSH